MTLRQLLAEHPEWADHEIAIQEQDGNLTFIGHNDAGGYYTDYVVTTKSDTDPTLILLPTLVLIAFKE